MNEASEKVFEYIDAMASKLGVASEHVYGVLVKQQVISGVMKITLSTIILTLLVISAVYTIRIFTKAEYEKSYYESGIKIGLFPKNNYAKLKEWIDDNGFLPFIPYLFTATLLLVVVVMNVYSGVGNLVNPEYYAIKEILNTLK